MSKQPFPPEALHWLLRQVDQTKAHEIACDEAYQSMDQFAESRARGEDAGRLMPLVQQHLDLCPDCRAEFAVLLRALATPPA